ncbi:MAG: lipopolysaccharide heptosyltransferase I [Betaproteobacteria bacterium]|nr:lipopolysaccharide heptosyltransferase I [Betaproteobacteria bacterium]
MRVLLVKLSSLGDVVHSLPAAMDLQAQVSDVQIDWVVEPAFAPLLKLCPAVKRIIPCNLRQWRKSFWQADTRRAWHAFKHDLQATDYDAVIDLQGLTKSALISQLARLTSNGKRYAMANRTKGSGYEAPTRWVADVAIRCEWHSHALDRGRHVCAQALGYALPRLVQAGLQATPHTEVLAQTVALVHGSSRADKAWPLAHWQVLGQALQAQGFQLALPHANDAELQTAQAVASACPGAVIWPHCDLVKLTQRLAACAGVVGVDSGVSHIAVALGLPHVQIYNFNTAWRTGPKGCAWQQSVFATPTPSPATVLSAFAACMASEAQQP